MTCEPFLKKLRKNLHIEWDEPYQKALHIRKKSDEPTSFTISKRGYVLLFDSNRDNNGCNASLRKSRKRKYHILLE